MPSLLPRKKKPSRPKKDNGIKLTYGIDPGKSGAIALLDETGKLTGICSMPEDDEELAFILCAIIDAGPTTDVWVERIPKYAGKNQSGSSVATLFANYRYIIGFLEGRGVLVNQVVPQAWQKPYRLATKDWQVLTYSQRKKALHEHALSEFFTDKKFLPRWAADAALIALHGHKARA
jgi:hypothetical protein